MLPPNPEGDDRGAPTGTRDNRGEEPLPFRNSRELQEVIQRIQDITVSRIANAAGMRTSSEMARKAGITDDNRCLGFGVLGLCTYPGCKRTHSNLTNSQAGMLLDQMKPGLRALLQPSGPGPTR